MAGSTNPPTATNGALPAGDAARELAGELAGATAQAQTISADEIALYDRQIRLWGVQAQQKIRTANILLVTIKALANEVAKNLVLAGIGSLTIVDHELVTEDDLCSQFFISESDVGINRAQAAAPQIQKLNPRVSVHVDTTDIRQRVDPSQTALTLSYFAPFDIIIATDLPFSTAGLLNSAARDASKRFYYAGAHGFYGFVFADLISHTYVIERSKSNKETLLGPETATRSIVAVSTKRESDRVVEMVTKQEAYSHLALSNTSPLPAAILNNRRRVRQVSPLLPCFRALFDFEAQVSRLPTNTARDDLLFTRLVTQKAAELQLPAGFLEAQFLREFRQNVGSELAPVTAFLGGQLAQDVINVLGQRQQPIQNWFFFDGEKAVGPVYALHPVFEGQPVVERETAEKMVSVGTGAPAAGGATAQAQPQAMIVLD